jgi:hypothetical protein
MNKYRHELKFIISKQAALMLKSRLSMVMDIDRNNRWEDKTYLIRSLYFDDVSSSAFYDKMDGVWLRKKYRIRYYNHDPSYIVLEAKHKHDQMTYKQQQVINQRIAQDLSEGHTQRIEAKEGTLLAQFLQDIETHHLIPSVMVDYFRLAYVFEPLDVRVTFDEYIKSGLYTSDLFSRDFPGVPILMDNEVVLEVKFNEIMPDFIRIVLETVPKCRMAISKFAICRAVK